jgi:hypothetical protein
MNPTPEEKCCHSFRGSDYLCIKCGLYFPETNEGDKYEVS